MRLRATGRISPFRAFVAAAMLLAEPAAANDLAASLAAIAPEPAGAALDQIPDFARKLLALRSYLRAGSRLADRWSWTETQIKAFDGTPEHAALAGEIAAVGAHFAACNPDHAIYVHSTARSLEVQIDHWNKNESVGAAAAEIAAAWTSTFGDADEPGIPDAAKSKAWLAAFKGTRQANIAAPGLSPHGRGRAIDFQIMKGGKIVAGADSHQIEPVWRAEHWDARLLASMNAAGPSFFGPLKSPDEPWHFDYDPARRPADRTGPKTAPGAPIDCGLEDGAPPAPK